MTNFSIPSLWRLSAMVLLVGSLSSCQVVKPYQKNFLNDAEMELTTRPVQLPELSFQSYREAAAGANGGKSGGGCGCN